MSGLSISPIERLKTEIMEIDGKDLICEVEYLTSIAVIKVALTADSNNPEIVRPKIISRIGFNSNTWLSDQEYEMLDRKVLDDFGKRLNSAKELEETEYVK